MKLFAKPTIVISRCIEHEECRYDKSMIRSEVVEQLLPYINVITVCPEMAIGLPSPRESLRLVKGSNDSEHLVFSRTGEEKTLELTKYSKEFLTGLKHSDIDGFILKHRSPSCGYHDVRIYKGLGKAMLLPEKTQGVFGRAIKEIFPHVPIENEGRLRSYNLRENFLIAVFTLRTFKNMIIGGDVEKFIRFHSVNKYMFMALSPSQSKLVGKLVANHQKIPFASLIDEYEAILVNMLTMPLTRNKNINVLSHMFGYFKDELSYEEKDYFIETLELYRQKKLPYSVPLAILKSWAIRFEEYYLLEQTIFEPFPKVLFDITDSGKVL